MCYAAMSGRAPQYCKNALSLLMGGGLTPFWTHYLYLLGTKYKAIDYRMLFGDFYFFLLLFVATLLGTCFIAAFRVTTVILSFLVTVV